MEQTPSSGRSPELPSVSPPPAGEIVGSGPGPERQADKLRERQEKRGETPAVAEQAVAPPAIPINPSTTAVPADEPVATPKPISDPPAVANDDDLIEKEWVEKAKSIITATKDDPYRREQEVTRLQVDYLQKRYGRDVGSLQ